jgi:4-hydroxy-tetrahydrodipicolinate synthase
MIEQPSRDTATARASTTVSAIGLHVSKLSGYAPALPTPFDDEGKVDTRTFELFCDRQLKHGATALIVCGTTGEAPTLTPTEHVDLIRIAKGIARGRIPVVAGAGSNSTAHAIALSQEAEAAGADAILSVVPYYNRPIQSGMHAHFSAIAQSTGLPIFLYDVPARTGCGLADNTIARLAEHPQIIGLKDATGDVTRVGRLRALLGRNFRLLSGDDATALAFFAQGGDGCISVTSNIAPGLCRSMYLACRQDQLPSAQRWALPIANLTAALFRETSPAPLKYALSLIGLMSPKVRLPLVEPTEQTQAEIAAVMAHMCNGYSEYMIGKIRGSAHSSCRVAAG